MFDLLFLTGAVIAYAYLELPPPYRGWFDGFDGNAVYGWVTDRSDLDRKVEVQLFVDGKFAGAQRADKSRPDVTQTFPEIDPASGFRFELPPPDGTEHIYTVFAVETSDSGTKPTVYQIGGTLKRKPE